MQSYEHMVEAFKQLKEAQENLMDIQNKYKDEPQLLSVYEPSAEFLVKQIEDGMRKRLDADVFIIKEKQEPDVWLLQLQVA